MPGISPTELEKIDKAINVSLDLLRHSSHVEASVLELIEAMRKELIAKLATGDLTNWGKARINTMLRETNLVIADYYARAQAILAPTYATVTGISAAQTATTLAASMPSKTVLDALVTNLLIEGSPAKAWWSKIAGDTSFRFAAAVRQGIAQGETMNQIFSRVNDIADMAGRNSTALVHTSVMQTMNDARMAVQEANADNESETVWLSALDSMVCKICAPRDGLRWKTLSKRPVGHSLVWMQPAAHFSCRCTTYAITPLTEAVMEAGGRASSSGVVKGSTTFAQYLERQTPAFQDEVLGKGRADLYRAGKITLRDLVSGRGAPISLKELQRKYA